MKKYYILNVLLALILPFNCYGQTDNLQFQFGNNQNFNEGNISSDYGPRSADFHNGVDFGSNSHGNTICPFGTPILSLVNGTVVVFTAFKQMKIQGTTAGYNFSYMHIFDDRTPRPNRGVQVGNFVLFLDSITNGLVSINLTTGQAIGANNGAIITYNGQNYTVSNQVIAGQGIAPMGNSGAENIHLHLYRLLNATGSTYVNSNNTGNALQLLNYTKPTYNINFYRFTNITRAGGTKFYSGSAQASIPVSVGMANAQIDPNANVTPNIKYLNVIKDVENVELFIKKVSDAASSYDLIKGPFYDSKIQYGGKITNSQNQWTIAPCYPSNHINNPRGSAKTTGVVPFAYYQTDSTNDVCYFSDIYTRIHNTHIQGQPITFASINTESRFPDGKYNIYAKVTTIRDSIYPSPNNIRPDTILIDNFRPYIEKVEVFREGEITPIYSRGWTWDSVSLVIGAAQNCPIFSNGKKIIVKIFVSEPMQNIKVTLFGTTITLTTPADSACKIWASTFTPPTSPTSDKYYIKVTGLDIAGNPVEGFQSENNVTAFPIRQDSVNWSPQPLAKSDSVHYFQLGTSTFTPSYSGIATQSGTSVLVKFTNKSTGTYSSSKWEFGDGSTSNEKNPTHNYVSSGSQKVKLTIGDCLKKSVKETSSYLTLLPYISRVEVGFINDSLFFSDFKRFFLNGKFVFNSIQNPINNSTSDIRIKVTPSGPLQKLHLIVKNELNKVVFEADNKTVSPVSFSALEYNIPRNILGQGINYLSFAGTDFGGNKLLNQAEPAKYPFKIMEGTSAWSSDTVGLTGIDNNYFLYNSPTVSVSKEIQVYIFDKCVAPNYYKAVFVNNSNVNYRIEYGDGEINQYFAPKCIDVHVYSSSGPFRVYLTRNFPASEKKEKRKIRFN
jgi:PKD repeat protein